MTFEPGSNNNFLTLHCDLSPRCYHIKAHGNHCVQKFFTAICRLFHGGVHLVSIFNSREINKQLYMNTI